LVNVATIASFQVNIDSHSFAVTEVDGTDVVPSPTNRIKINPAQRYSLILTTNNTETTSFWLRVRMMSDCFSGKNTGFGNPNLVAHLKGIIHYGSSQSSTNITIPTTEESDQAIEQDCTDMFLPLVPIPAITPNTPDHHFHLKGNFRIGDWRLSRGYFNQSSWRPNLYSPTLSRFIEGYQEANESFTSTVNGANTAAFPVKTELVLQIDGIQTVDVIIQNVNEGPHPLHLHGYKFFVLARGQGFFNYGTYDELDVSNPLRRDTAVINGYGWLLLRFVTDNPGLWAFHCEFSLPIIFALISGIYRPEK
jgi:FtsP/CotA-like multicopper oxidase with cupredoxin domain